jgi:hypothetical protein
LPGIHFSLVKVGQLVELLDIILPMAHISQKVLRINKSGGRRLRLKKREGLSHKLRRLAKYFGATQYRAHSQKKGHYQSILSTTDTLP